MDQAPEEGDDFFASPDDQDELRWTRLISSLPARHSSSVSSSSVSSPFSSRQSSLDFSGCPPQSEYEEIPSRRWLTLLFGPTPPRSRKDASQQSARANGSATAAGSTRDGWEDRLPPDYRKILARAGVTPRFSSFEDLYGSLCNSIIIDGGRKSFSLEKSTGKKCYVLSAEDLLISAESRSPATIWKASPKSRFSHVADIPQSTNPLRILGKIDARDLSPLTRYAAYLVFQPSAAPDPSRRFLRAWVTSEGQVLPGHAMWVHLEEMPYDTSGGRGRGWMQKREDFVVDVGDQPWPAEPRPRSDGWTEVELGDVFVGDGDWKGMVVIRLEDDVSRGGIVIEGIDVRPKHEHGDGRDAAWKFEYPDPLFIGTDMHRKVLHKHKQRV